MVASRFDLLNRADEAIVAAIRDTSDEWRESWTIDLEGADPVTIYEDPHDGSPRWLPLVRPGDRVPLLPHGWPDGDKLIERLATATSVIVAVAEETCLCGHGVTMGTCVRRARGRVLRCEDCEPELCDAEPLANLDDQRDQIEAGYVERAAAALSAARAEGWSTWSPQAWAEVQIAHQECEAQLDPLGGPVRYRDGDVVVRSRPEIGVVNGAPAMPTVFVHPHLGEDGLSFVEHRLRAAASALVVAATVRTRDRFAKVCDLDTPESLDQDAEALGQPRGLLRARRLATCLPSLSRVPTSTNGAPPSYEVVVVADVRAVRQALTADEHSPAQWEILGRLLHSAQYVVVMDSFLDEDDVAFVQAWRQQPSLHVYNAYRPIQDVPVSVMLDPMDAQRHACNRPRRSGGSRREPRGVARNWRGSMAFVG